MKDIIVRFIAVMALQVVAGGVGIANAVPMGGIESCALPNEAPRDCTFSFQGTLDPLAVGEMDTLGPVRVDFELAPFIMPHLESLGGYSVTIQVQPLAPLDGDFQILLDFFFIDGTGNLVIEPETMGDLYLWHGFQWFQKWTCATSTGCGGGIILTDVTFRDVRIGEWEKAPLPGTLALFGLGLAGLIARRRRA